jgi:hypothetical protein
VVNPGVDTRTKTGMRCHASPTTARCKPILHSRPTSHNLLSLRWGSCKRAKSIPQVVVTKCIATAK